MFEMASVPPDEVLNQLQAEMEEDEKARRQEPQSVLSEDTVWKLEHSPILIEDNLLIPEGAKLTIEPGVTVAFREIGDLRPYGANLNVAGSLLALGTKEQRILFTSISAFDKRHGGSPAPWPGVWVGASGELTLEFFDIMYAGIPGASYSGSFNVGYNRLFEMRHCTVTNCPNSGLLIWRNDNAPVCTLAHTLVSDNAGPGISVYFGYVEVQEHSVITRNRWGGLYHMNLGGYRGRPLSIMDSNVVHNEGAGIYIHSAPDLPVEHQAHGHRNNIYGNSGETQIGVFPHPWGHFLQNNSKHDWSENHFGRKLFENGCKLFEDPPPNVNPGHLSYQPHLNECDEPPAGPIDHTVFRKEVPPERCPSRTIYCGVDRVNGIPAASRPFDNGPLDDPPVTPAEIEVFPAG
jgi:hypothetical protein